MIHISRRVLIAGAAVAVPVVAGAAWALTRDKSATKVEAPGPWPSPGGGASAPSATVSPAAGAAVETAAPAPDVVTPEPTVTPPAVPAPTTPITRDPARTPIGHLPIPRDPEVPSHAPIPRDLPLPTLNELTGTGHSTTYTVKPGDTLSAIGRRFHVSVAALVAANHIADASMIRVGQVLTIPVGSTTPPAPTPTPTPAPHPHPAPAPTPSGQPKVHAGPVVYDVNTSKKLIALTFDDGPNGAYTDAILGVLKKHNVHATFFVLGQNVARDSARLRKEVAAGHAIGNHSWDHPQLTTLSSSQVRSQLARTSDKIEQVTGKRPDMFRAPYGARSSSIDAVGKGLGMRDILWDVDTVDWSRPGSAAITNEAVSSAHKGSIILMHDGGGDRSQTAASLDNTITRLQAKGYQFVTVPQLMAASGS